MELKNARLARAEDLSEEDRLADGLPERGLILIQTTNPDLKDKGILLNPDDEADSAGIRGFLLSFGAFNDIDIDENY